ncbi:DUF4365 domain-containing protein [Actinoplanes sp. NPDC026619]|uniref:DUF4365 domain-containing protein n=1 Tax=Actinoplanes sp. NPDC026619 TaxID=3155798 RepID=UPI0034110AFC
MTSPLSTEVTGAAGANGVGLLVNRLGWHFRRQLEADVGIDAQIETVMETVATARQLGVQIKAGSSWFTEPASGASGWWFRERDQTHRRYWLRYPLSVIVVLYDIEAHTAYWQVVDEDTAVPTGSGFKVFVPRGQRIDAECAPRLAELARRAPNDPFDKQVADLPSACADSLVTLRERAPAVAQELAEVLLAGRDDPAAAVRRLRKPRSIAWPWPAWTALAEYAAEYALNALAADCLLQGVDACDDDPMCARMTAAAGVYLITVDPERARRLLTEASTRPAGALSAAVGLATLDHGTLDGPIPVPAVLAEHPTQAAADATVQRFLGDQAARRGDTDMAITFYEKALELAPWSAAQMLTLAEALLRRREPGPGETSLADYRRAASLAERARTTRRRCRADSVAAARVLLHAIELGGDERSAIRVAAPDPDGEATDAEAASAELAFYAARLCFETGNLIAGERFEATIARSGNAEWTAHCAAVKASTGGANAAEQVSRWRQFLDTDAPDDRRLVALNHLAELGVWPLPDLERMHSRGLLTDGFYNGMHAEALAAAGRWAEALDLLRPLSRTSIVMAESYARKLAAQGDTKDSVLVCDEAAMRFGDARMDLLALDVLSRAGRTKDVQERATELLSRADLPANLRHRIRCRLIDAHGVHCDWLKAEKLARSGLSEVQDLLQSRGLSASETVESPRPAPGDLHTWLSYYSWAVIVSLIHRGQIDDAFVMLERLDPVAITAVEIATWGDLHQAHGWTPETAERALAVAGGDDVPIFVAAPILFSLQQFCRAGRDRTRVDVTDDSVSTATVSEQLARQIERAWADLVGLHPAMARALESDGGSGFAEQVRALLLPHAIKFDQAREAVRAGRLPLGVLSAATGEPYVLSLVRRAAGMITAITANDGQHSQEIETCRSALDGAIVIEGSALYLASATTQLWAVAKDAFAEILIPEPAAHDVVLGHRFVAEGAAAGARPGGGNSPSAPLADALPMQELHEAEKLLHDSKQCRPVVVVADTGGLGVALNTRTINPWLAPIAVAIEHDIALFSDDVYLRRLAGYFGARTFGSLALIEVLLEAERINVQAATDMIENFFRLRVVDLPNAWPLAARIAQVEGAGAPPILTNLARTSFWQDIGQANFIGALFQLLEHVQRAPGAVEMFTSAAAAGLTATFGPPERVLATLGTAVILTATDLTAAASEPALRAIRQLAAQHGWNPIPQLRDDLIAALVDPDGSFAMSDNEAVDTAKRLTDATP